ncbi:hypothetical protein FO519_001784 [Halicephalobus sp. NKZ332]|nr:hypothetical protein FO519_001784 [Halicephalobus sp. NKZ332]
MLKTIVVSLLVVGVLSQANTNPTVNGTGEVVKNFTAAGQYYGHGHHHHGGHHGGSYDPPIIDDYICDLDATILVVTNNDNNDDNNDHGYGNNNGQDNERDEGYRGKDHGHGHGGYGKGYGHDNDKKNADRLKCSVIASDDNDSCSTCCRLAARRDRSIAQSDIVGFVVDDDQIDRNQNNQDRNGPYRSKRDTPSSPGTNYSADRDFDGGRHSPRNPLCVCCAPRKFGFPHFRTFHHHHHGGY